MRMPYSLLVLAFSAVSWVGLLAYDISPLKLQLNSYSCNSGQSSTFKILTISSDRARQLADAFCAQPEFRGKTVTIEWRPRNYLSTQHLIEGQYDLLWTREHLMRGYFPDYRQLYSPVAGTRPYDVLWFSRAPLSESSFKNPLITIGLLSDQRSQTFHLKPMAYLQKTDFRGQLKYFAQFSDLKVAFRTGAVDVMPAPAEASIPVDRVYRLILEANVSSGFWYSRVKTSKPEFCASKRVLIDSKLNQLFTPVVWMDSSECSA